MRMDGVNDITLTSYISRILQNGYIVDFDHPAGEDKDPGLSHHVQQKLGWDSNITDLGEHTNPVLREIGGYSQKELQQLRDEAVI